MFRVRFLYLTALMLALSALPALAQDKALPPPPAVPAPPPAPTPPPPPTAVAATVNGQQVMEMAVYRALRAVPDNKKAEARVEVLNFLIDNVLIEQYLKKQKIEVDPKDVDARVNEMREQLKKEKLEFVKVLQDMFLTEAELREHMTAELRWEKFVNAQATEPVLKDLFAKNMDMFDGSLVHARHILLTPASDAKSTADARALLQGIRPQLDAAVNQALAKLPANSDNLARQKERTRVMEETFGAYAKQHSACPSKERGGDVDWFPRVGSMVEPFAKAAFALKPGEVSDVVQTPFGLHLILCVDRKPGKEVKFEEARDMVKDVYAGKMREALVAQLRPAAKITK